jgi:hypothetical protein
VPHITLKSIANNAEIDVIWDKWQAVPEPLREKLNSALKTNWQEWEIPRELTTDSTDAHGWTADKGADSKSIRVDPCSSEVQTHRDWWEARIARQREIDASIAAKAEFETCTTSSTRTRRKSACPARSRSRASAAGPPARCGRDADAEGAEKTPGQVILCTTGPGRSWPSAWEGIRTDGRQASGRLGYPGLTNKGTGTTSGRGCTEAKIQHVVEKVSCFIKPR